MRFLVPNLLLLSALVACERSPPASGPSATPPPQAPPTAMAESAKPSSPPPPASASAADEPVDAEALTFFNELSGSLRIELTEPAVRIHPQMLNQRAPGSAKIKKLELEVSVWVEPAGKLRPITDEELGRVVFRQPSIRMIGEGGPEPIEHAAPDGKTFTVRDLVQAVEETERQTRGNSEWFGGVDVHHTFFEGMTYVPDKRAWSIHWGS